MYLLIISVVLPIKPWKRLRFNERTLYSPSQETYFGKCQDQTCDQALMHELRLCCSTKLALLKEENERKTFVKPIQTR
jgi:hypothetical protein